MRKVMLAATVAAALGLPLGAQQKAIRAEIPFEFNIGNAVAPAGNYDITLVDGTVGPLVRFVAGKECLAFQANPGGSNSSLNSTLVFHRYDDRYFLAQVRTGSTIQAVPESRVERELKKKSALAAAPARQEILLAAR